MIILKSTWLLLDNNLVVIIYFDIIKVCSLFLYCRYAAAEADCNKCIKLDPKYIKAYLRRGTSRIKLAKPEAAREDFQKVRWGSVL